MEELKATAAKNFQEAMAESDSTTADIRKGIQNLSARRTAQPTAQELFDAPDASKHERQTGLDLGAMLEAHEALLQGRNGGKEPPKVPTALAGNPDDLTPPQNRLPQGGALLLCRGGNVCPLKKRKISP